MAFSTARLLLAAGGGLAGGAICSATYCTMNHTKENTTIAHALSVTGEELMSPVMKSRKAPNDPTTAWGLEWDYNWHHDNNNTTTTSNNTSPFPSRSKAFRQLILIRHGQYHHNDTDESITDPDKVNMLTELGKEQSFYLGKYIAKMVVAANVLAEKKEALQRIKHTLKEKEDAYKQIKKQQTRVIASPSDDDTHKEPEDPKLVALVNELKQLRHEKFETEIYIDSHGCFLISPTIRRMYVSDMIRARVTAEYLRQGMQEVYTRENKNHRCTGDTTTKRKYVLPTLFIDPSLKERFPCWVSPTSSPPLELKDIDPSEVPAAEDVFSRYFFPPKFTPALPLWTRIKQGLEEFQESYVRQSHTTVRHPTPWQTEESVVDVVVGHSNMIRYLTLRALQMPPEGWLRMTMQHGSVTSLKFHESGKVTLMCYGSMSHMPPLLTTNRNAR